MEKIKFGKINHLRESTNLNRLENPPIGIPRYNINGEGYYSVTQILDDGKFAKIDPRILLHSQILGSVVHLQIENYFKQQEPLFNLEDTLEENQLKLFHFLPDPSEEDWDVYIHSPSHPDNAVEELVLKKRISTAYNHFTEFLSSHEIEPIWSEEIIWNPQFLYAGTVDLLCYLDGKLTIVDHKTSRFIDETQQSLDNYTGQLSAYSQAIKKLEGIDADIDLQLLHLDPLSNTYKLIPRKYNFSVFLDAHVRFSQTKFLPENEKGSNEENDKEKKLEEQFITKEYSCADKNCKEKSVFPFPRQKNYLIDNQVKNIVRTAFHQENGHYAVFNVNISNLLSEKKFIYKNKET